MKVARHWARETVETIGPTGRRFEGSAWGWSSFSVDEARRRARESATRLAQWLAADGVTPPESSQYMYSLDRPPREEIIQEFHDATGEVSALITRNSYGSLVLNCRDLMFVDVDFRPPQPAAWRKFKALFGITTPPLDSEECVYDRVQHWCAANDRLGLRNYRTAAGFRVAIIGRPMRADDDDSRRILEELGSDPMYRRLCDAQQCFRARLTPKPWRMKLPMPPSRFPFADVAKEQQYRAWQREYDEAAPRFATCRLLEIYGPQETDPALSPLVQLHDALSGVGRDLVLA
jgi:hypothetical protein